VSPKWNVLVVAIVATIALAATATGAGCAASSSGSSSAAAAPERQLRVAVTGYAELLDPVRPAKFYGRQLTPVRCVSFMKGRDAELETVATGEAFTGARSDWSTLAGLIRQEQEFGRSFGAGQIPTACRGDLGYWEVLSGGGDTYVVRAAVLETVDHGRWDAARHGLADTGSLSYDEAAAYDYTLCRVDGVWKVTAVHGTGLSFTRGGGQLHPDSA
jgi:hypothetical protein